MSVKNCCELNKKFKKFLPLLNYLPFENSGSKNMHHQKKVSVRYTEAKRFPKIMDLNFFFYSDMQITRQSYFVFLFKRRQKIADNISFNSSLYKGF